MPFRIYSSADPGAPSFSGAQGNFIRLLKAVLVDGYGQIPPAGWSAPFVDLSSHKIVLRNGASSIARSYFRVVEDASNIYTRGFHDMTGIDTGTGAFPTTSQVGGSGVSTIRTYFDVNWKIFADERTCLALISLSTTPLQWVPYYIGDVIPIDPANSMASVALTSRSSASFSEAFHVSLIGTSTSIGLNGHMKGTGSDPASVGISGVGFFEGTFVAGVTNPIRAFSGPSAFTGGKIFLRPFYLISTSGFSLLARLRFVYIPFHSTFSDGDTFGGTGLLSTKRFIVHRMLVDAPTNRAWAVFETQNPD
jgi:hypothetical protein